MQLNLIDTNQHEHKVTLSDDGELSGRHQSVQLTPELLQSWALQHRQDEVTLDQSKGKFYANALATQLAEALGWTLPAKHVIYGQFTQRGFDATTGVVAVDVSRLATEFVFTTRLKDSHTSLAANIPVDQVAAATGELFAIQFSPLLRIALPVAELQAIVH